MTAYHKIETLYDRDEQTFRIREDLQLRNPVYGLLKTWQWTEKIDGTNARIIWTAPCEEFPDGKLRFGGKTDDAQIPTKLLNWLADHVPASQLATTFPRANAVIYGEGYGAGIQKGGIYRPDIAFIGFDVAVQDKTGVTPRGWWWLNDRNMRDVVCRSMGLDAVPSWGEHTLEWATDLVRAGFPSQLNGGKGQAEGLVGRPLETLFDKKGERLIVKLKTRDFRPRPVRA